MKWGILISVLLYELVAIVGIGVFLSRRQKKGKSGEGFLLSNRDLPTAVVAVTLALTVLGTPHIFGLFEMAWHIGAISIWFGLAHVLLLVIVCTATGRWARRMHITTMPELVAKLFGEGPRMLVGCAMAGMIWGILTLESQGIGIVFSSITGISIQKGAIIGGIFGVLYVIIAGMKEIGWVNLINCVVMYLGLILSIIVLTFRMATGWQGVTDYYVSQGQAHMLSLMGTPELMLTFALGIVLSTVFCQAISQQLLQPAMSAKSEQTIKRALWIAAPVNGLFGIFVVCIGLAAKANPEFNPMGPKMAAMQMLLGTLPPWLVAWLFASFLAAVLSSFAMTLMAPATIFTIDIYKNFFNGKAHDGDEKRVTRIVIVVLALAAVLIAAYLPPIVAAVGWLFSWMTPVFWLIIFGLFWKRSSTAATVTLLTTWALNMVWSFSSVPALLGVPTLPNVYITLGASLLVGGLTTAVFKGRTGLFREQNVPAAA